jgi:AraC-like DNA-binding protein
MPNAPRRQVSAPRTEALDRLRAEVLGHLADVPQDQRETQTAIPFVSLIRMFRPTEMNRGVLEPSLCLVLQGRKAMLIGQQITHYGAGSYVLSIVDMPVSGRVVDASVAEPYVALKFLLDPKEMAAMIVDLKIAPTKASVSCPGAYVALSDTDLQEAFLRLVRLLKTPNDTVFLSRLIGQEILYRLLTSSAGRVIYQSLVKHTHERGITEAILWIKKNFAKPMKIEQLADSAHMSVSALHRRFKAITVMSPLQYQKQTRLIEARKLLLTRNIEAATAAYEVGYQSPSQFSREYRRFFGNSPLRDIARVKGEDLDIRASVL